MAKLTVETQGQVTIVRFGGSLAGPEVRDIEPKFNEIAQVPGRRLVVDLSNVLLINTPAITIFVSAVMFQRTRGGKVVFTGTEENVDRLLRICKLDAIMPVIKDPAEAIKEAAK
jgi:anti-anti-sigma factor